jgi:hypothetical protein
MPNDPLPSNPIKKSSVFRRGGNAVCLRWRPTEQAEDASAAQQHRSRADGDLAGPFERVPIEAISMQQTIGAAAEGALGRLGMKDDRTRCERLAAAKHATVGTGPRRGKSSLAMLDRNPRSTPGSL